MKDIIFQDLIDYLDEKFPKELAEDWDKVGLHFGSRQRPINKVMTALDVRPATIEEAIQLGIDTIIVHHPPLFNAIKQFDLEEPIHEMYAQIIKHDLNIYAMHTNVDRAEGGMNDWLAKQLGLEFVHPTDVEEGTPASIARVGQLPEPLNHDQLINHLKKQLKLDYLTLIQKNKKTAYQKIMIVGGAGSSLIDEVREIQPDCYITGDLTFHDAQEFYEYGLTVVDAGHYIEHIFNEQVAILINEWAKTHNYPIEVIASQASTDPFKIV